MTNGSEIREGTPVKVRRDNGTVLETIARSKPWQLGGGHWVVLVEGIAGGYSLDRVSLNKPQETK